MMLHDFDLDVWLLYHHDIHVNMIFMTLHDLILTSGWFLYFSCSQACKDLEEVRSEVKILQDRLKEMDSESKKSSAMVAKLQAQLKEKGALNKRKVWERGMTFLSESKAWH